MTIEEAAAQAGLDILDSADWPAISILSGMMRWLDMEDDK